MVWDGRQLREFMASDTFENVRLAQDNVQEVGLLFSSLI